MTERGGIVAIPEQQLKDWTAQGSIAGSARAYESVQQALAKSGLPESHKIETFLQGSFRNSTNVERDSDVDVVVNRHGSFFPNVSSLPAGEAERVRALPDSAYKYQQFRQDVRDGLIDYYGSSRVIDRNKCVTIVDAGGTGISADVVPAFDFRYYYQDSQHWHLGIAFLTQRDNERIIGFPKQHYDNGVRKHGETNSEFKPTVRLFKNAASEMVDRGLLDPSVAPSYFIECLIYNVPASRFGASTWEGRVVDVYNWLESADLSEFVCVNGILYLFGPKQWTQDNAQQLLAQFKTLWNTW